jgi:hypothetical protein
MFKPKTTITGRLENSSGEWIRTTDLRVMRGNAEPALIHEQVRRFSSILALSSRLYRRTAYGFS